MKKYLITGLLIWIPLVITIWVLKLVVDMLDQSLLLLPQGLRTENWLGFHMPGMGVLLTLLIVMLTGVVTANFIGQRLVHFWNEILHRIPVVSSIYSSVKQVCDTLVFLQRQCVSQGAAGEWPRAGMWTIAFSPGARRRRHQPSAGRLRQRLCADHAQSHRRLLRDGARKDVIELDMSVDEALKYVVSMGVVAPERRTAGQAGIG